MVTRTKIASTMLLAFLGLGPISTQAAASHETPPSTVEPTAAVGPRLIRQSVGAWMCAFNTAIRLCSLAAFDGPSPSAAKSKN